MRQNVDKSIRQRLEALERIDAAARQLAAYRVTRSVKSGSSENERISKMIKRNLYRRLEQLEAHVMPDERAPLFQLVYAHPRDGKPACSSVVEPDGRRVWLEPPEGCKKGEPVENSQYWQVS